jgi:hypothetical protein
MTSGDNGGRLMVVSSYALKHILIDCVDVKLDIKFPHFSDMRDITEKGAIQDLILILTWRATFALKTIEDSK